MVRKLEDKISLVTGGSAGIGLGIAQRFAAEGARVFITGRRQSELEKAVSEIGGQARWIRADASSLAEIDEVYRIIREEAGRLDILVANAGFYEPGTLGDITEAHFDRIFDTNVRSALFTVQKALPLLAKGASVILTGSIASFKGFPSFSVYDASKAAVRSFARGWILDLNGRDIRINVLSPGHTETPGLSALMDEAARTSLLPKIPLNRLGTPDDLGRAAVFLASDDSAYITGTELVVDGGVAQY
jgi:NAD(P)-dependent dehydrogenase (short-subunit alcohol dehydrogenase family)